MNLSQQMFDFSEVDNVFKSTTTMESGFVKIRN